METKKCIYCGMDVEVNASRCQYCGSILEAKEKSKDSTADSIDSRQLSFLPSLTAEGSADGEPGIEPLSNAMKVFLTALTTLIPGIGQIIGIIISLLLMNTSGDPDRKSFGKALLITALLVFVITCMACFAIVIIAASAKRL